MSALSALGLLVVALVLAALGGAAMGTRIGGEFMGNELAAMLGALFGPSSVLPATAVGLLLLVWLR